MSGPVVIDLTKLPPSNNARDRIGPAGNRYITPEIKRYRRDTGWEIKSQRPGKIEGPYHLKILAARPDKRKRDIDNIIKELSDLLVSVGVVEDDSLAQSVSAGWSDQIGVGCRVILTPVEA